MRISPFYHKKYVITHQAWNPKYDLKLQINQNAFKAYYRGNIVQRSLDLARRQIIDSRTGLKALLKHFSVKN